MHSVAIITLLLIGTIVFLSKKQRTARIQTIGREFEPGISEKELEQRVIETSKDTLVMVDFYFDWRTPCHALTPLLAEVAADYKGNFLRVKISTNDSPNLKMASHLGSLTESHAATAGPKRLPATSNYFTHLGGYPTLK